MQKIEKRKKKINPDISNKFLQIKNGKQKKQLRNKAPEKTKLDFKTSIFKCYSHGIYAAQNGDGYETGSSKMENRWRHQVREHVERRDTRESTQEWKLLSHS